MGNPLMAPHHKKGIVRILMLISLIAAAVAGVGFANRGHPPCFNSHRMAFDNEFNGHGTGPFQALTGGRKYHVLQLQDYSPQAVTTDGHHLVITATRGKPGAYISGRVDTKGECMFRYGTVNARIKTPLGKGLFPAFWLISPDKKSEIDVMEQLGGTPNKTFGNLHSRRLHTIRSHRTPYNLAGNFHVYGAIWTPNDITFTLDYQPYAKIATRGAFQQRVFLILNLAIGGSWAGPPDSSTRFPARMVVDWVRVSR